MPTAPKRLYYCESCGEENLKTGVIDALGSVFCSKKHFQDSAEYRSPAAIKLAKMRLQIFKETK